MVMTGSVEKNDGPVDKGGLKMGIRISTKMKLLCGVFGACSLSLLPGVALAQGAGANEAAPEGDTIVVTARKTNERSQDVPITLSALSGEDLRNRTAVDVKDVLKSVPGFSFTGTERGLSRYNIRGVSTSAFSPTVGIYLDDISLVTIASGFSGALDPVFFDMERLEVLKGPQGTLYGGSAMGGAIKYVSARPNLSEVSASVTAGGATTAHGAASYNGEAVINLPLIQDKLAVRGGIYYRHEGGYIDNDAGGTFVDARRSSTPFPVYTQLVTPSLSTLDQDNHNSANTIAGRLSLEWQPDPSLVIRPQAFYQDYKQRNPSQLWLFSPELSTSFRLKQPTHDRSGIYSLSVDKDLGSVAFTSLTAYFDRKLDFTRDYSFFVGGLVAPVFPLNTNNLSTSNTKTFSQEVRLQSNAGADAPLSWVAGLYYSHQKDRLSQIITTPGAEPIYGGTDLGYLGITSTVAKQYAAFGEASYRIADGLSLTAGLRAFEIKQTIDASYQGILNGGTSALQGNKSKDKGINPKVGVSYKVSRDNLIYASAAKGFRAGGPNRFAINSNLCRADLDQLGLTDAPASYKADKLWQYEIGTKNTFAGGRAMINAALFYTDWKGIQQLAYLNSCGFSYTANAGTAHLKGIEGEGRYNFTRGWQVGANGSYVDAKLVDAGQGTAAQRGDRLQAVPKWTASFYSSYKFEIADDVDLMMRADYQYQSNARLANERTVSILYSDGVRGPQPNFGEFRGAYDVVNAFVSIGNDRMSARLYVNNLLDNRPLIDRGSSLGDYRSTTLRPRTVGLEVRRAF